MGCVGFKENRNTLGWVQNFLVGWAGFEFEKSDSRPTVNGTAAQLYTLSVVRLIFSAVRIDYFCSRLLVDYFSYNTRITFQRRT